MSSRLADAGSQATLEPILPAVTCSVQSTFLTGLPPSGHGAVGNGWYFRELGEVFLWRQHNKLVDGEKVWETIRRERPDYTVANVYRATNPSNAERMAIIEKGKRALQRTTELKADYFEALVYLSLLHRQQAPLETDPLKQQALVAEADRIRNMAVAIDRCSRASLRALLTMATRLVSRPSAVKSRLTMLTR